MVLFWSSSVVSLSFCSSSSNALSVFTGGRLQVPSFKGISSPAKPLIYANWLAAWRSRLHRELISVTKQIYLLYLIIKHQDVPWLAKIAGGCALGYVFSPIQLIPNFIPIIGQSDDLLVLYIGMKVVRSLTPPATLMQCQQRAESVICADRQLETGE